jgi:hypothetical protein
MLQKGIGRIRTLATPHHRYDPPLVCGNASDALVSSIDLFDE